jgi:hypothetical protein
MEGYADDPGGNFIAHLDTPLLCMAFPLFAGQYAKNLRLSLRTLISPAPPRRRRGAARFATEAGTLVDGRGTTGGDAKAYHVFEAGVFRQTQGPPLFAGQYAKNLRLSLRTLISPAPPRRRRGRGNPAEIIVDFLRIGLRTEAGTLVDGRGTTGGDAKA